DGEEEGCQEEEEVSSRSAERWGVAASHRDSYLHPESGGRRAPRFLALDDLRHLAGLPAPGAHAQALGAAAADGAAHRHQIGHPAPGGDVVGVADAVTIGGALPADVAALRHGAGSFVMATEMSRRGCRMRRPFIAWGPRRGNRLGIKPERQTAAPSVSVERLDTPLQFVKGVGPPPAKLCGKLGLGTVGDALLPLPRRHEDRSQLTPLGRLAVGPAPRTCAGTVAGVSPPPRRRPQVPLFVTLRDATGFLRAVWFGQPYLARVFRRGQRLIVHGKIQPPNRG